MSNKVKLSIVGKFGTILADPPWEFQNSTGKVAPKHKRLKRYETMSLEEIKSMPVSRLSANKSHLYLWVPNAFIKEGIEVMEEWGFKYKTNIVWHKIRKDGGPDGRGVGFYFRNWFLNSQYKNKHLYCLKTPQCECYLKASQINHV